MITDGYMDFDEFLYESITDHLGRYAFMDWSYAIQNSETSHYIHAIMIDLFL